ncbi:hypothetical protein CALCODRAFT_497600 [Calocera cornea HHB12733]|uniref:Uncharacterized protein n=1 Tax=Calocera cornea HHB12733 TaxID=1353952 RepID=A0A165F6G8_9BASI|nr:hypothetical protein CALCODRAFT_497600 [Calocera cornea HHB12733]
MIIIAFIHQQLERGPENWDRIPSLWSPCTGCLPKSPAPATVRWFTSPRGLSGRDDLRPSGLGALAGIGAGAGARHLTWRVEAIRICFARGSPGFAGGGLAASLRRWRVDVSALLTTGGHAGAPAQLVGTAAEEAVPVEVDDLRRRWNSLSTLCV